MPAKKKQLDILACLMPTGLDIEWLQDLEREPERLELDERAAAGAALAQIAEALTTSARKEAHGVVGPVTEEQPNRMEAFRFEMDLPLVRFTHRAARDAVYVDTVAVKKLFPEEEYPQLYAHRPQPETVVITVKPVR